MCVFLVIHKHMQIAIVTHLTGDNLSYVRFDVYMCVCFNFFWVLIVKMIFKMQKVLLLGTDEGSMRRCNSQAGQHSALPPVTVTVTD